MEKKKRARCHNCKHASESFKIAGKTHYHCFHPKYSEGRESGALSAWETLMEFSEKCDHHEFKDKQ